MSYFPISRDATQNAAANVAGVPSSKPPELCRANAMVMRMDWPEKPQHFLAALSAEASVEVLEAGRVGLEVREIVSSNDGRPGGWDPGAGGSKRCLGEPDLAFVLFHLLTSQPAICC